MPCHSLEEETRFTTVAEWPEPSREQYSQNTTLLWDKAAAWPTMKWVKYPESLPTRRDKCRATADVAAQPSSLLPRSRNALAMTLTDDKAMAAAATAGDRSIPVIGYNTPAAIGMPATL